MTDPLILIDFALRCITIGALLLISLTLLMRRNSPRGTWALSALALTVSGYLLISGPSAGGMSEQHFIVICMFVSLSPLALAATVFELLAPESPLRKPGLVLGGLCVLAWNASLMWPVFGAVSTGLKLLLFGGIVWVAIQSDDDDLVAGRRVLRRSCAILMGGLGLMAALLDIASGQGDLPMSAHLMQSVSFFLGTFCFGAYVLSPETDLWPRPAPEAPVATGYAGRVQALMAQGIWRREGLTVAQMATELNLPEHRLRQVINQELDQRNFSGFINAARIDAACKNLSDPEQSRRTVLEIAYEVGFASLGPFNRAFKEQMGMTPTAYRAQAMEDPSNVTSIEVLRPGA